MAAIERARSIASSAGQSSSREQSLTAPTNRQTSKGGVHSSTASVASSDVQADVANDGSLEKSKTRNSEDGRSDTSSSHRRRMSKLFKGRRRRRQSQSQEDLTLVDTHQSDDIPPVPDLKTHQAVERNLEKAPNQSEESLGLHKSVASSLLTQDSDSDSSPVRPGISPHHSHAGYLTLSSPLITSETVDTSTPSDATGVDSTTAAGNTTPRHSHTIDVTAANKRGTSPVGKLKEAFTPTRRSTSPKPPPSPGVTDAQRPATSGGLGSLFGGKRRTDKVLDESTALQDSPPQLHQGEGTQSSSSLPLAAPRRIITQVPSTPPNLVDAPLTLVTPPTPTDGKGSLPTAPTSTPKTTEDPEKRPSTPPSNPNIVVSPSGNMISHRRARSSTNPPSKLSNSISAPLTPTLEEAKTPGGTAVAPQQSPPSGFFSSVFSAAQNAATSLGSTIANTTTTKTNKPGTQQQTGAGDSNTKTGEAGGEEVISPPSADSTSTLNASPEKRRLAVETLGSGNLSLAQLGYPENASDQTPMSSSGNLPIRSDEASAKAEDMAATQAVNAAYAASKPPSVVDERPRSVTNVSAGAASPPRQPEITDSPAAASIQRQGSIRSRISGGRTRRHRGSSATTGHTIAAGLSASTSTLAPQAVISGQRLNGTGFAVASPKRNREFHNLFKSVPEDDYLIEDYSAALQKEILLHGRLYISEGHLCFSSNILGWVTNLVISFDEVVSVEKKSTAVLFPNAIVIQTLHARNVFASFLSRDSTYDLIIGIWKISHPNLKSSLNGVALDGSGTGDKTEKAESIASDEGSIQGSDDEVYDEDAEEDDGLGSFTEAGDGSVADSEVGSVNGDARKAAATVAQAMGSEPAKTSEGTEAAAAGGTAGQDFPGAATHAATDCGDNAQHYDKLLIDTTISAPLGKVYSLMFGPASGVFMRKWLIEDQKSTELQMEDDKKGLGEEKKTFSFNYIKPLPGSIGPRQTKCITTMNLEQFDLDKAVSVLCSTQTPDVPSGNIFVTKTRYCLMWGPGNSTRLVMTFTVEWSGKSWLKGPIEKGANDGQMTYATSLSAALRTAVTAKAGPTKAPGKGGKGKKRSKAAALDETPVLATETPVAAQAKQSNWGLFEPIRSLLGPVADILESIFTPQITIFLLGALLIYTWYFRAPAVTSTPGHWSPVQRQIAYEELWRHEESDLWKWLEERVALDRVHSSVASAGGYLNRGYEMQDKLVSPSMQEREIDEAIRVTEEKLGALKNALQRERDMSRTKSPKEEST